MYEGLKDDFIIDEIVFWNSWDERWKGFYSENEGERIDFREIWGKVLMN